MLNYKMKIIRKRSKNCKCKPCLCKPCKCSKRRPKRSKKGGGKTTKYCKCKPCRCKPCKCSKRKPRKSMKNKRSKGRRVLQIGGVSPP